MSVPEKEERRLLKRQENREKISMENEEENSSITPDGCESEQNADISGSESDIEDLEKQRTPSGNIIVNKASDIRNFFSPKSNNFKREGVRSRSQENLNSDTFKKSINRELKGTGSYSDGCSQPLQNKHFNHGTEDSTSSAKNSATQDSEAAVRRFKAKSRRLKRKRTSGNQSKDEQEEKNKGVKSPTAEQDQRAAKKLNMHTLDDMDIDEENKLLRQIAKTIGLPEQSDLSESDQSASTHYKNRSFEEEVSGELVTDDKHSDPEESNQDEEIEANMEEDPQSLSLTSIYYMFLELQKQIAAVPKFDPKFKKVCVDQAAEAANNIVEDNSKKVKDLEDEVAMYKHKTDVLTDVVNRMHVEKEDMLQRLENLELASNKKSITISGLEIYGDKDNLISTIADFLSTQFGEHFEIDDVYKMGKQEPKLIVVALQFMSEKRYILKNKGVLKGKTFEGKTVYINDYVPLVTQEKRRREREIVSAAKEKDADVNIVYGEGTVAIQGVPYRKRVSPPTPKELIQIPPEELHKLLQKETPRGPQVTQDNSRFIAYTAAVKDFREIRQLYMKMKLIQPNARHIPCAYIVQGEHTHTHFSQDFHDDGEPGAGRNILDMMKRNQLENRVIFVARRYGGVRMGPTRFECYVEAAKGAVQANPFNEVLQRNQVVQPDSQTVTRGRGRSGRGRGSQGGFPNYPMRKNVYAMNTTSAYQQLQKQLQQMQQNFYSMMRGGGAIRGSYPSTRRGGHMRNTFNNNFPESDFRGPSPSNSQYHESMV